MSDTPLSSREKMAAVIFALVATAILVELGFHVLGSASQGFNNTTAEYPSNPRGYFTELRTEKDQPVYGVPMDKNVGLGGRTGPTADGKRPERILGLGDSQAQGQGVYFRDTMYEKLGEILSTPEHPVRIRNAAVSGYDLDEIAARYTYEARDPGTYDLVLYTMVLDDFGLNRAEISGHDLTDVEPQPVFDPWRARSATWNFVAHIMDQWTLSSRTTEAYLNSFRGERLLQRRDQLKRFAAQVRTDGAELVVIVMPLLYDFEQYPFTEIHETMQKIGEEDGLHVLDILPILQTYQASDLWVHAIDHHPNEVAHERIATAIQHHLNTEGLIKTWVDR